MYAQGRMGETDRARSEAGNPPQQSDPPAEVASHNQSGGITANVVNIFGSGPLPDVTGPIVEPTLANGGVVQLADYVEYPASDLPRISHRHFRGVVLRGPILLGSIDPHSSWVRCHFSLANDDPASVWWVIPPDGSPKLGVAGIESCIFEDCRTEAIALAGTVEQFQQFREGISRA